MRNPTKSFVAALAASLLLWGCSEKTAPVVERQPAPPPPTAAAQAPTATAPAPRAAVSYTGPVVETMDAASYTYVQVDTGTEKIWAAAPQFTVNVGDEVTVPAGMPMSNYHSKTLDRTFDVVYFVGAITPAGAAPAAASRMPPPQTASAQMPSGQTPAGHPGGPIPTAPADVDFAGLDKAKGGNTVSELLADASTFAGKEVMIRGKVVKFNAGIMGKNWIHVQDGSGEPGANDLTVTTDATAAVGDTVLVKGVAAADRDFGYGYNYAFIVEDAQVNVE